MITANSDTRTRNETTGALPTPGIRNFQKSSLSRCIEKPVRWYHRQCRSEALLRIQIQSASFPGKGSAEAIATTQPCPASRRTKGGLLGGEEFFETAAGCWIAGALAGAAGLAMRAVRNLPLLRKPLLTAHWLWFFSSP